jgi:hypothetical protein
LGLKGPANIKQIIRKETEHIFEFIQEYVNEIAMNSVNIIRDDDKTSSQKMEALDWTARNLEFISPKLFDSFINFSHEIHEAHQNTFSKNSFFSKDHQSSVMKSMRRLVLET